MDIKYVTVAAIGELSPGTFKRVSPSRGNHMLICNVGGDIHAIKDACTHDGGMLGFGQLVDGVIECPRHGAKFSVETGDVLAPPASVPLLKYEVRIRDGDIQVAIRD